VCLNILCTLQRQSSAAAVKAAEAEEKSRAEALAMAKLMQAKFDQQEQSYQQQEAAQKAIICTF
jgi:hypothetical protein